MFFHSLQWTLSVKFSFFSSNEIMFRGLWFVYNLCTLRLLVPRNKYVFGLKVVGIWLDMLAIIVFLSVECLSITCMTIKIINSSTTTTTKKPFTKCP